MNKSSRKPYQGEIWLAKFKKTKETPKTFRPCLVISNDIQNEYDHHIIVAPLSDEDWEGLAEVHIFEILIRANAANGLEKDSKILLNRVRAVDKELRKRDYCGVASEEIMEQVNKGLELVLNIKKSF